MLAAIVVVEIVERRGWIVSYTLNDLVGLSVTRSQLHVGVDRNARYRRHDIGIVAHDTSIDIADVASTSSHRPRSSRLSAMPCSQASCRMTRAFLPCILALGGLQMPPKGVRKRPASTTDIVITDDALHRRLIECGASKTGLVATVQALSEAGWLTPAALARTRTKSVRRRLQTAVSSHASATTPYGRVVQRMQLPGMPYWEFVHPLALLAYWGRISEAFFDVMDRCVVPGRPLTLIIYIDEVCPGNPLRPEKSRTLQAIYWAFAEWPQWLLQRSAAWAVFGTIRSTIVAAFPGGVSYLMARIVDVFFSDTGPSLTIGVSMANQGRNLLMNAKLGGFLADEKAHNQIGDSKGASGCKYVEPFALHTVILAFESDAHSH